MFARPRTLTATALVTVFTIIAAAHALPAQTIQVNRDNRTLAVTATDSASAFADLAVVHIGFEAFGADEQSAYAAGSERSNAILGALTQAGIAKDRIESENQQLAPLNEYELRNQAAALKGMRFRLTQSWTVRTTPDDSAKVLDLAIKSGANQSGNIDWELNDPSVLEAQAAAKALAHAQSIAARMAEGLHTHIGPLLYASNQAQEQRPAPFVMRSMAASAVGGTIKPLAITNRKIERSSTVYAVFQIE